jgi:hypothetical protein
VWLERKKVPLLEHEMNQGNQSRLLCYFTAQEHHLITSGLVQLPINIFSHDYRKSSLYALFTIVAAYASKTYNHLFKTEHEYVNMTVADKPLQITSMETLLQQYEPTNKIPLQVYDFLYVPPKHNTNYHGKTALKINTINKENIHNWM